MKIGANMRHKTAHTLSTFFFAGYLTFGIGIPSVFAENTLGKQVSQEHNDPALTTLLNQANYWHNKSHDELAIESLKKVLMVDANNAQALYLMALWSQQRGKTHEAAQWKARLEKVNPHAPQLQALTTAKQLQQLPKSQLTLARQQANNGNITGALTTWRQLFSGDQPPISYAPEYYLTMAGDKSLYPKAVEKLRQLNTQYPQDNAIQITLAKVLTYRENTRRAGIHMLEKMATQSKEADSGLRQALLWLEPQPSDEADYQTWRKRHPKDEAVLAYYHKNVSGTMVQVGFKDLNHHRLNAARTKFTQVLETSPNNADALAGMGYILLRHHDYEKAAQYLKQAAAQGGKDATSRKKQAEDATFYAQLAQAKQAYQQGNIHKALDLSLPLAKQSGKRGIVAKLFRADVLRRHKNNAQAERLLRDVLRASPGNVDAKEALYYVLKEQNKAHQAQTTLQSLPKSSQLKLAAEGQYSTIRDQARQALRSNDPQKAVVILTEGVKMLPENPWLRLDLARIFVKQTRDDQAEQLIKPLRAPHAKNEDLYAAALFANDQKNWSQVQTLLERIPQQVRNQDEQQLIKRATFNLQITRAKNELAQGDLSAAIKRLKALSQVSDTPYDAGKVALYLAKSGDLNAAIAVVQQSIAQGIKGNAGDYADQISVLYQAGLANDALALLNNKQLQANSTPQQMAQAYNVMAINEADKLREQGHYASAYDTLIKALQQDPQNVDLMLAMARLYQSGKMNQEARLVYNYLLAYDTPNQDARLGAINVALTTNHITKARQLAEGLKASKTPDRLFLLARISEAEGHHQQALAYLRKARARLLGLQTTSTSTAPELGGLVLADNPFISTSGKESAIKAPSVYGTAMPWQVPKLATTSHAAQADHTLRPDLPVASPASHTLSQIDTMMDRLYEKTASWGMSGLAVRSRDGENGLSKLTEAKIPLQWSTVPTDNWRLETQITPISLNAGTTSTDASRRFGTGALIQGQVAHANGTSSLSGDLLPDVASQGDQSVSGVEVGATLSGKQFQFDIGTTPLGAKLTTLVGGIQWSPQLSDYSTIILKGERRAVTDSLLSYVGAYDKYSGTRWGQVTKNGASVQLSYDDGDVGFYAGTGGWRYVGKHVADNSSIDAQAGAYMRPLRTDSKEFKVGVGVNYAGFSKNLSYYSLGQGGYFSPQTYISISFPMEYKQQYAKLHLAVGGALGFQSYSEDRSPYFPNNQAVQTQLENYVAAGETKEAYYHGSSSDGIGYNLHATVGYKINKEMTFGARVVYDTYGDYNETTAQIWLRHTFGAN